MYMHVYACMHVCMHACMCVCRHVHFRVYVCHHVWISPSHHSSTRSGMSVPNVRKTIAKSRPWMARKPIKYVQGTGYAHSHNPYVKWMNVFDMYHLPSLPLKKMHELKNGNLPNNMDKNSKINTCTYMHDICTNKMSQTKNRTETRTHLHVQALW